MDAIIASWPAVRDHDLMLCEAQGVAYQWDMSHRVEYGADYVAKCASYEDQPIANAINRGRIEIVAKWYDPVGKVLDIGVGSGEFVRKRPNTWGIDINPVAIAWLKEQGRHAVDLSKFKAFTCFDTLEHVPDPAIYLDKMPGGSCLFLSIPIYADLTKVRASRHYRPGEHLYYHTHDGLIGWLNEYGFSLLEVQTFEIEAGRDSIYTFAFKRDR